MTLQIQRKLIDKVRHDFVNDQIPIGVNAAVMMLLLGAGVGFIAA